METKIKKIVELSKIRKSFNTLKVIENLSLVVKENEIVSFVGPSGCGKSTALRIIAGLEKSEGMIERNFKRPAFIFQEHRLLPWKTALDNILFVLFDKISSQDKRKKIAKHYLDLVGLGEFGGYYPSQLSGGMKKRVSIARALAIDPDLILMDEPFSDLDFPLRLALIDSLKKILKRESKTVLYATHDIREALLLSHRIYIFSNRPMHVKEELLINKEVREQGMDTPEFLRLERHVIELLKEESLKEIKSKKEK